MNKVNKIVADYNILIFLLIIGAFYLSVRKIPLLSRPSPVMNYDNAMLFLRITIGIMFIIHGLPKLTGGPPAWTRLGQSMANFGFYAYPSGWGFMAAFAETFGGLFMITGLFFRPAMLMMSIHMSVACIKHYRAGDSIETASHAIEALCIFLFLFFSGPGKFALDRRLFYKGGKR
jgi:putative oxidoreductase